MQNIITIEIENKLKNSNGVSILRTTYTKPTIDISINGSGKGLEKQTSIPGLQKL